MENDLILQVGVKALLKNSQGKYLLVYRSDKKYAHDAENKKIAGHWDVVGGRINLGQSLQNNLQREIKEETNLDLIGQPQLIAAQDIFRKQGHHIIRLTYLAECTGKIELDLSENEKYIWLTLEEMQQQSDLDIYLQELLSSGVIKKAVEGRL